MSITEKQKEGVGATAHWIDGYNKGRRAKKEELEIDGHKSRIAKLLSEASSEYRCFVNTAEKRNLYLMSGHFIALGKLLQAENIFMELGRKESERVDRRRNISEKCK